MLQRRQRSGTVPPNVGAALPLHGTLGTWVLECPGPDSTAVNQFNWRPKRDSGGYPRTLQAFAPGQTNACPQTQSVAHSTLPSRQTICNLYRQAHTSASPTPFIPISLPKSASIVSLDKTFPNPTKTDPPSQFDICGIFETCRVHSCTINNNYVEATAEPRRRAGSKEPGDHQVAVEAGAQQDVL